MKILEILEEFNRRSDNIKCFNDDIFFVMKTKYDVDGLSEGVCDKEQVEKIMNNDDIKKRGLKFSDILKLSGYFGDIKQITRLNIENNVDGIYKIKIESNEFDELETDIEICNDAITIRRMKMNKFIANNWIGTNYIVKLIYFAKELGFKEIYTTAAKIKSLDKKYKNKGYFFFPKLGFLVSQIDNQKSDIIIKIKKNPEFFDVNSINELLLTEDEEGNRIGLEFWKQIGDSVLVEFDLSDDSKSMEILRKYLEMKNGEIGIKNGALQSGIKSEKGAPQGMTGEQVRSEKCK